MELQYLDELASIIRSEGIRDTFITEKRLKELNKEKPSDLVIYHSENIRGTCVVYYGDKTNSSFFRGVYKFKLGNRQKEKEIKSILSIDKWISNFNATTHKSKPSVNDIKNDLINWVNKHGSKYEKELKQFIDTLKVGHRYTGQLLIAYKEFNGETIKIKPVIKLYETVTIKELIEYGKSKSMQLWNREFTCRVEETKTYWKHQLGVYYPHSRTIKFSIYQNALLSKDEIYDTMLHEMVHWHLHTSGKPHGDEDFEFIEECLRVGCSLSKDRNAQKAYQRYLKSKGSKQKGE